MKKQFRLLKQNDFQRLIKSRSSVGNSSFVLYHLQNNLDHSRVGISVSSKNHGDAVNRNLIKRQIRMMAQKVFKTDLAVDYIIIARKNYREKTFADNLELLTNLYEKVAGVNNEKQI
ncbi:MAG: ribonuclease P protein component [Bacillales bacterium]|jgi:ribonuclease P protein component|nr:ribonuclease P protein component [Bacillales bacterium]